MAEMKHDVAKKVREHGGDAVIMISSSSQLQGYYSTATVNAQSTDRNLDRERVAGTLPGATRCCGS